MNLILAMLVGLAVSVGLERLLSPRHPTLDRPFGAWCVHIGLWLLSFVTLLLLVQRPWFAMLLISAFLMLIVVISNAKFKSLAEPFTVQDFRYLRDAIRYPRLYLPFLGWGKALLAGLAVLLAVVMGLWIEPSVPNAAFVGAQMALMIFAGLLLLLGNRFLPDTTLEPVNDLQTLGLLGSLWDYSRKLRKPLLPINRFEGLSESSTVLRQQPHLVAVQSESFFDPRGLMAGIRQDVLSEFDRFKALGRCAGPLVVPALGANTVRSEFGFLAGVDESLLGAHKFNPYESVLKGWQIESVPMLLKRQGYRTVCIHPYAASFYSRHRVFPMLGIDEFIDLSGFVGAERSGHYVSDAAVADKILEVLATTETPTFVFAITMENHGPLHLEQVEHGDVEGFYNSQPPAGFDDLTIYLRHLKNADRMVGSLIRAFDQMSDPVSLCWYGDHVPIMPDVYDQLQHWPRDSNYLIWDSRHSCGAALKSPTNESKTKPLAIHQLARAWLDS